MEKTFPELEAQANAMIQTLSAQRNAALDQCVNLMGQVAILEMRIVAMAMTVKVKEEDGA